MDLETLREAGYDPDKVWNDTFQERVLDLGHDWSPRPLGSEIEENDSYLLATNVTIQLVRARHKDWIGSKAGATVNINRREIACLFLIPVDSQFGDSTLTTRRRRFDCGHSRGARDKYCLVCEVMYGFRIDS